jgi:hypothetical protein
LGFIVISPEKGGITFRTVPAKQSSDYVSKPEGVLSHDQAEHVSWQLRRTSVVCQGTVGKCPCSGDQTCDQFQPVGNASRGQHVYLDFKHLPPDIRSFGPHLATHEEVSGERWVMYSDNYFSGLTTIRIPG